MFKYRFVCLFLRGSYFFRKNRINYFDFSLELKLKLCIFTCIFKIKRINFAKMSVVTFASRDVIVTEMVY